MGLGFNATILYYIIQFLILILYVAGIIIVIKTIILIWSFKNKIETMDSELKEIRRLLEDKKG